MIQDVIETINELNDRNLVLKTSKHRSEISEKGTVIIGVDGNKDILQLMINHLFLKESLKTSPGIIGEIIQWHDGTPKEDGRYLALTTRSKQAQAVHIEYKKSIGFYKQFSSNYNDIIVTTVFKWAHWPSTPKFF